MTKMMFRSNRGYDEILDAVIKNGGELFFDVMRLDETVVTTGYFEVIGDKLRCYCEGAYHENITSMSYYLKGRGFGETDPNGSEGSGDVANSIYGHWSMFANIRLETGITLSELVDQKQSKAPKQPKAPKAPKAPKVSKADQRPMRPANGKAVWNDAYIKAKGIDYAAFLAKHGKQQVYDDLGSMTVIEFETKYGLR